MNIKLLNVDGESVRCRYCLGEFDMNASGSCDQNNAGMTQAGGVKWNIHAACDVQATITCVNPTYLAASIRKALEIGEICIVVGDTDLFAPSGQRIGGIEWSLLPNHAGLPVSIDEIEIALED